MWLASGQAAEVTARALGISVFHLYENKEALQLEVLRLRQENLRLTEQRDILKKAAGILSEPPPSGMPGSRR